MPSRYEHRNINFFGYNPKDTAQGAQGGTRTLSDWNRHVTAGKDCVYYINGRKLSDLRARKVNEKIEYIPFSDVAELKNFFKTHLFTQMSKSKNKRSVDKPRRVYTREERLARRAKREKIKAKLRAREHLAEIAAEQALLHWHQAGIQHATYQNTHSHALNNFPTKGLTDPVQKIEFDTVPGGVKITEENVFRKWNEIQPNGKRRVHEIPKEQDAYFAKTKTTYIFQPEVVVVKDVIIDCPDADLAPVFDKRPDTEQAPREKGNVLVRALYSWVRSFSTTPQPKPPEETSDTESETTEERTYKLK